MKSSNYISKSKLNLSLHKIFPNAKILSVLKFNKGLVNDTYKVVIKNPRKKIVFRFYSGEPWKAEKESYLYNLISKKTNVPVPEVYYVDITKKIFLKPYAILSYLEGIDLGKVYAGEYNKRLAFNSGEILAKLHSIRFSSYGWIIGSTVTPSFSKWRDFINYDVKSKVAKLIKMHKIPKGCINKIKKQIREKINLLDIVSEPVLIHKDYHFPHIIVNKYKISGIIDLEWALAGHKELDLIKPRWFMFKYYPQMEKPFMQGYKKYGSLSKKSLERIQLYELITLVSMVNFAFQMKNKSFIDYYLKEIFTLIEK